MPYNKTTGRELVQCASDENLSVTLVRLEETEHGFRHCNFWRTELIEDEQSIFVSNDSNLDRAFHVYDTIRDAITL